MPEPLPVQIANLKAEIECQRLNIAAVQEQLRQAQVEYHHMYGIEIEVRREAMQELQKLLKTLENSTNESFGGALAAPPLSLSSTDEGPKVSESIERNDE